MTINTVKMNPSHLTTDHDACGVGLIARIDGAASRKNAQQAGIKLPAAFGLGMVFMPPGQEDAARKVIETQAKQSGLKCLGWRSVPINPEVVGPRAYDALPVIEQCFFRSEE